MAPQALPARCKPPASPSLDAAACQNRGPTRSNDRRQHMFGFTRSLRLPVSIALAATVVAVAACSTPATGGGSNTNGGGSGGTAATAAPVGAQGGEKSADPCGLVTPEQVAKVLRTAVAPAAPYEEYRGTHCKWDVADGPSLLVSVYKG